MSINKKRVYLVPAVVRALNILEYVASDKEANLTKIFTELKIPKSSTFQILSTLRSKGYLRQIGDSEKYSLGLKLFELGSQAVSSIDIRTEAIPVLRKLVAELNETCHLGIQDGNEGIYLVKLEGTQGVRLNSWEGKRLHLHSTAIGKALLAWKDANELNEITRKIEFTKLTNNTITGSEDFKKHLMIVKKQGYALDDEENEPHIRCIAAPIRNINGKVESAISISGLSTRFKGKYLLHLANMVQQTSKRLSKIIGNTSSIINT